MLGLPSKQTNRDFKRHRVNSSFVLVLPWIEKKKKIRITALGHEISAIMFVATAAKIF